MALRVHRSIGIARISHADRKILKISLGPVGSQKYTDYCSLASALTKMLFCLGHLRLRQKPSSRTTLLVAQSYFQASGTSRLRSQPALVERLRLSRS